MSLPSQNKENDALKFDSFLKLLRHLRKRLGKKKIPFATRENNKFNKNLKGVEYFSR